MLLFYGRIGKAKLPAGGRTSPGAPISHATPTTWAVPKIKIFSFLICFFLLLVLFIAGCGGTRGDRRHYTYRIIKKYPHDPAAFTQGLVYDGKFLYESTGLRGRSQLRQVDLRTGKVLRSRPLSASFFGEGLALVEDRLIQLTYKSHVGMVYGLKDFALQRKFIYPNEGWGLAYDGRYLIMSDGTATLSFLDPRTYRVVKRVTVRDRDGKPIERLNELEYIDGEIYANVWQTDRLVKIDPQSGSVTGWIDLTGLLDRNKYGGQVDVLNGIAYDKRTGHLLVTGKLWPVMFEIELVPTG